MKQRKREVKGERERERERDRGTFEVNIPRRGFEAVADGGKTQSVVFITRVPTAVRT